jgi:hypothetical protein
MPAGIVKPFGTQRVPKYGTKHRRIKYDMTEATALATSFGFFKVKGAPDDAMI